MNNKLKVITILEQANEEIIKGSDINTKDIQSELCTLGYIEVAGYLYNVEDMLNYENTSIINEYLSCIIRDIQNGNIK